MATDFLNIFLLFQVCFLSVCMCERLTSGSLGSKGDSLLLTDPHLHPECVLTGTHHCLFPGVKSRALRKFSKYPFHLDYFPGLCVKF